VHGGEQNYLDMEIHYINGYRNRIAQEFGVEKRPDVYIPCSDIFGYRVRAAEAYVRKRVTGDALLENLAQSCLEEIHERFKEYASRPLSQEDAWRFYEEYEGAFKDELRSRYGEIESNVLVNAYEGKGTEDAPYRLIEHPALLMRAIGRSLKKAELFAGEKFRARLKRRCSECASSWAS
jgi:hypothetical protein